MLKPQSTPASPPEPADARAARLAHERALIAEGEAAIAAGQVIPDGEVDAWLDRLAEPNA